MSEHTRSVLAGLFDRSATAAHGPRMEALPACIIVHVFTKKPITPDQYSRLREQTVETIFAQGRRLVDLVIDPGPPSSTPPTTKRQCAWPAAMPMA